MGSPHMRNPHMGNPIWGTPIWVQSRAVTCRGRDSRRRWPMNLSHDHGGGRGQDVGLHSRAEDGRPWSPSSPRSQILVPPPLPFRPPPSPRLRHPPHKVVLSPRPQEKSTSQGHTSNRIDAFSDQFMAASSLYQCSLLSPPLPASVRPPVLPPVPHPRPSLPSCHLQSSVPSPLPALAPLLGRGGGRNMWELVGAGRER